MKEARGNLWTFPADIRCITTNGDVNSLGDAIMGRGCAREARDRYPGLAKRFAAKLQANGNVTQHLGWLRSVAGNKVSLMAFPVKHHWHEPADLALIATSTQQLVALVTEYERLFAFSPRVVLPRPGCGNGGRAWEREVRPILEPLLDDRFTVITF
jgi:hypothetical protein